MAVKAKSKRSLDDEPDVEPFSGALKEDLLDLVKRRKIALAQRTRVQEKLAALLDLDPQQEAKTRFKEHDACIAAAVKRAEQLRATYLRSAKKAPPLLKQIQEMLSRKGI